MQQRWQAGCHNATTLWRELKAQGYKGAYSNVSHYLAKFRQQIPLQIRQLHTSKPLQAAPSIHQTAWLFGQKAENLAPQDRVFITQLCHLFPQAQRVYNLAQSFSAMVRERNFSYLENWLTLAKTSEVVEIANFAQGLCTEQSSIAAAISLPWSNGQVEGQINKLKLIKRQMYGRAKIDLMRQRVLYRV